MSEKGTTRLTLELGEEAPRGETDWARVSAMSDDEVFEAALADPDAQPLGPEELAKMRRISSAKALRRRLGPTQVDLSEEERG